MHPIDHLWDVVEQESRSTNVWVTDLQQLCDAIVSTWARISGMLPEPC